MNCLYVLNIPENEPIVALARTIPSIDVAEIGPYFAVRSTDPIFIDRRASGVRHAVWYSWVAGLDGWRITQWDKDGLAVAAR